jgi:hypothetical protein
VTSSEIDLKAKAAVRTFWRVRNRQNRSQGSTSGKRDAGNRASVTGGKQLDGFVNLCRDLVVSAGIDGTHVYRNKRRQVPGFYRAEKNWDIVVVVNSDVLAIIEFKAQVGSLGNNCNNRMEEAIGSATDLWAAYREGAFGSSVRPWLGYVFLLEDSEAANRPVKVLQPHFNVFPEFVGASYATRYEILMQRLLRDRLYDGAALLLSPSNSGRTGAYRCPNQELSLSRFAIGLTAHAAAYADVQKLG